MKFEWMQGGFAGNFDTLISHFQDVNTPIRPLTQTMLVHIKCMNNVSSNIFPYFQISHIELSNLICPQAAISHQGHFVSNYLHA
jgi:hypothetical protein